MKITILALYATCLCALSSFAQNTHSIKGSVADSSITTKLMATVTVLNAKDSIMYKFAYAGNDGSFNITGLPAGKFLLLVTYPEYADYIEGFDIAAQEKEHVFGNINMQLKTSILQEVIIKGNTNAISLKGDTTVVNARALVIQPNAKVEDLLVQVPGIEIDKSGKIKFQGQEVKKMLVDGEEFFGDDPTLVTRNIRGDMVDKFEIYDKKSKQAEFTGIDDGVKNKTINVVLKEDKKTGVFGKIIAGGGTGNGKGFYEEQAMVNKFTAQSKYSAYATTANDGTTGLGYADNDKLGTSSQVQISDDISGTSYRINDDLYYGSSGLPVSRTAGAHFDTKWNKKSESLNANFKAASLGVTSNQRSVSQSFLPGATGSPESAINQFTNNTNNSYDYSERQKLNGSYQNTFSPSENLNVSINASTQNNNNNSNSLTISEDGNGELKNRNESGNHGNGEQKTFNASAMYSKRLKKAGRTISWAVNDTYGESNNKNYYMADTYTSVDSTTNTIDQYKPDHITSTVFNSNITYTEPITKNLALTFNYGLGLNNSSSDKESFNKSPSDVYNARDTAYSNDYQFNQLTNQVGAEFNYRGGAKTILVFGTKASSVNFKQVDVNTMNVLRRNFINWAPQSRLTYKISTSQTFSIEYYGSTMQPTIDQIQPVKVNTDALRIMLGNPDLKPSFRNSFNLYYSQNNELTNEYFYISGNYSITGNAIVNSQRTDVNTLISQVQYINLNKATNNYYISTYYSWRTKLLGDTHANLSASASGGTSFNEVNSELNESNASAYSASFGLRKEKRNKYSISASIAPRYTFSRSSLNTINNNNAPSYTASGNTVLYLPWKMQLSSNIDYTYNGKTKNLPSTKFADWDGSVSRTFFKSNNLKVSLTGNNLLNQDRNYRSQYAGSITQSYYNTIKRYFMFSVSWDFTKFGTTAEK